MRRRPSAPGPRRWSFTRPSSLLRGLSFRSRRTRFSLIGLGIVVACFTVVGPISFSGSSGPAPVLPDTQQQFSLDLKVIDTMEHDLVYVVEQRARPAYRIFSFDPATGTDTTGFTVPKDAIVYGIALSPDRSTLAVAYSPDFHIGGSGISLLDLGTKALSELTTPTTGVYDINLEWSDDATAIYSSHVDQRNATETLDIARTSVANATTEVVIRDGVSPTFSGNRLYYLEVDSSHARRSIRAEGSASSIAVGDGTLDLDHLVKGSSGTTLRVGVLTPTTAPSSITVGTPAAAHGNHNVASTWWNVSTSEPDAVPIGLEATVVYDAVSRDGSIVLATLDGLSIVTGKTQTNLIASRALRFVAT